MKFIHFSDLHIGKWVNEFSMLEDQKYILKVILRIIDEEKPDGILIAGDVYDKPGYSLINTNFIICCLILDFWKLNLTM